MLKGVVVSYEKRCHSTGVQIEFVHNATTTVDRCSNTVDNLTLRLIERKQMSLSCEVNACSSDYSV
jgi:hypothetical protein